MPVSAQERRFLLGQASRLAQDDVASLWAAASALPDTDFAQYVIDGYPQVVDPWVAATAAMAAVWFEDTVGVPAVTAPPIPAERLTKSAQWAVGGEQGLPRLQHTTQRAVFDGARDTTLVNVERNNIRWARDARPNACVFCRLLASRTGKYLYRSEDTAATEVHNDCQCVPIEVVNPDDYELPEYVQAWQDEYYKASANAGSGDMKAILSAWRSQSPEYK